MFGLQSRRNLLTISRFCCHAGKTYTMTGELGTVDRQGLAPRIFARLFERIAAEESAVVRSWQCQMSRSS